MKRLLTLAAMFLCSLLTFAQFTGSGSGTESDPYLIFNPIQLDQLRNFLNKDGVCFKLMADIDLTEYLEDSNPTQGWQPVGTTSTPFKGILDGNDKKITGLWIERASSDYVGFFGATLNATIKNTTIKFTSLKGNNNTGLLIGYSQNTLISDCKIDGEIWGLSNVGGCIGASNASTCTNITSSVNVNGNGDYIGGLIGYADGSRKISECHISTKEIIGGNYVGGICGVNLGGTNDIVSCFVNTNISGNNYVGGISGSTHYYESGWTTFVLGNISKCGFWGSIKASSCVGGIAGSYYGEGEISDCYAVGDINAMSDYVGGLIGSSGADIRVYSGGAFKNRKSNVSNCYFCGSVYGLQHVGGLIGYKYAGSVINCYVKASVYGTSNIGGLIGYAEGFEKTRNYQSHLTLKNNAAITNYVKATGNNVARIVGKKGDYVDGTVSDNKASSRSIVIEAGIAKDVNDDENNGTGVSLTMLKLKATYVAMGFDFTDTWEIQETECHPYMKTQTAPPVITSSITSGATVISGKCVDGGMVTLEIDGVKQQKVSSGHDFSFNVSPLQAGHEVRLSAKADGKELSYYTTEVVSFLGKGTEADPYLVYTAADLTCVYRRGYYKQMIDIDLAEYINQFSPTEGWQSIGRDGSETIHFDGDGHKITGLWCNSTRDNTGLFSCFANGTIKNLTVETAKGKQVKGGSNTGILIGKIINGTIENCRVTGTVVDGTPVGGMVGLFDGGKISLSQANVIINTTREKSYVGGLVGEITSGEIDQCVTLGTVTATGKESYVGGLVGKNSSNVTNCYSNANVTSSYNAAGLIAYNYGVADKCYATGNIFSSNYGAGVIGYNDGANAVVKN